MSTDRPRILIVTQSCGFPNDGLGETVRVRAFASGLSAAGADVSVHMVMAEAPGPGRSSQERAEGEWRGIPFEYMHGSAQPVPGWLRRRAFELLGLWRTCRTIRACARSSRRTAVILFSPLLRAILPIRLACTVAHVPLAHERSEFPFVSEDKPTLGGRLWRFLYLAAVFRLFDGQIVISTLLEDFVRERARRGSWILRVPILVDADAFSCSGPPTAGLVGYAGNLSHSEELFQFVGAVSVVATAHGDVRACIMGGGSPAETAALERETARLGVADRIELAGRFAHDDMPARLCSCAVLALPRTQGLFSSAGFPTKLGEYLATGRPVVVTATGDIPMYLRPGVDAFVVPPDDSEAFSAALERALYEPASVAIGDAGRDVARTRFDPATHMGRVLDALETSWAG